MKLQTKSGNPSVRVALDYDADGAFVILTRFGAAAERIPLSHRDAVRIMSEVAQVVLVKETRRKYNARYEDYTEVQANFIGTFGE